MVRQGRELERLVAILEEALRPDGVHVTSPDRIPDSVTGRKREVDVVIRTHEGGTVLAICECRDRRAVADVTWVEQVVTKARDLEGSPAAVLVSTSGFTPEARKKAASYGLDVRLVTEVSVEEFRSWFRVEHAVTIVTTRALHGCEIRLTPEDADEFSASTNAALNEHGVQAAIFQRRRLGPLSADQLFEQWYGEKHDQVERDVPADGRPVRRRVPVQFEDPEQSLAVETSAGLRTVAEVGLLVEITRERRLVPVSAATRYEDEDVELAESVEFRLGDDLGTISVHRTSGRPTHIHYRQPEDSRPSG